MIGLTDDFDGEWRATWVAIDRVLVGPSSIVIVAHHVTVDPRSLTESI